MFPLDHFVCCAAILVLLTLINTHVALGAAEVPVVIMFSLEQTFSSIITKSNIQFDYILSLFCLSCRTACTL